GASDTFSHFSLLFVRCFSSAVRSGVAGQFADLDRVPGGTFAGDGHGCIVVGGLDDPEAHDDFLGFDIGTVGHESSLHESAGSLQSVASGHNRRAELLHPCVPGRLQSLHFLRRRLGAAFRGFAIDEQKLRHDGTPDGFAYAVGGLSPALCEYNERAAIVRTPAAPEARKAAARSSSRRTMARTGSPRSRSRPVTVRPTAPS